MSPLVSLLSEVRLSSFKNELLILFSVQYSIPSFCHRLSCARFEFNMLIFISGISRFWDTSYFRCDHLHYKFPSAHCLCWIQCIWEWDVFRFFFFFKQRSFSEAQIGLELTVLQEGSSVWQFSPISSESWVIGVIHQPALISVLLRIVVSNSLRLLLWPVGHLRVC